VDCLDFTRSSVSTPMSELEYDLLGAGYANGFSRALTTLADQTVEVLTCRQRGHLYTALASVGGHPTLATRQSPADLSWTNDVLPRILDHFIILTRLADEPTSRALVIARELFAEIIMLHHAMLIPARRAITELLALAIVSGRDAQISRSAALMASAAIGTPLHEAAERLASLNTSCQLDNKSAIDLTAAGAVDGDGYGLALPGWLDDASYARRAHNLLQRFGVTRITLRRNQAAVIVRRDEAVSFLRRDCSARYRRELELRIARAQYGAVLAEAHGPVLHVRYIHALRNLVLAHGRKLADQRVLDRPEDIVHARLDEIAGEGVSAATIQRRRTNYRRRLAAALPPPSRRMRLPAGHRPVGPDVIARMGIASVPGGRLTSRRTWSGVAGAPGDGHGTLRFVRAQKDMHTGPRAFRVDHGILALPVCSLWT
jgi:hypothetical protein